MKNVMLWAGAGQIGMAIARRMGTGMKIVVGDKKIENVQAAARIMNEVGFDGAPVEMDLSSRESIEWGKRGARFYALYAEELTFKSKGALRNAAGDTGKR